MNTATDTKRKTPKAFRLSDYGEEVLLALSRKLGVNQTGVIELAIRRMGEQERVISNDFATAANAPEKAAGEIKA